MNIIQMSTEVRPIITDYDALSERCVEVDTTKKNTEVQEIVIEMKKVIRAHKDIVSLAANQIGFDKRIVCLNFNGDIRTFVNPILESVEGIELSRECCHSIPGKTFIRIRHTKVKVSYQTPLSKIQSVELVGYAAIAMQHAIDHLDGLLVSDVGLEIDSDFDNASEEEKQQVIDMYLDSLDLMKENVDKAIDADPEAKKMSDAVRFIASVQSGQTKLEHIDWTDEQIALLEEYNKNKKN